MVITDLDGTLLNSQRQVGPLNRQALTRLRAQRTVCAIATGRSLFSFRRVISPDFPIDYLIFSTGAGIMRWPDQTMLHSQSIHGSAIQPVILWLKQRHFDFMIQHPIPDNHHFWYHGAGAQNPDFHRRIKLYADFATPLDGQIPGDVSQLVVIFPPGDERWQTLAPAWPEFTVCRATSPLDHRSVWMEFFPKSVSKSQAAHWLCRHLGIQNKSVLAVGNDYNDVDLLEWAGYARVVANAPDDLKPRFTAVSHHDEDGFAHAVAPFISLPK